MQPLDSKYTAKCVQCTDPYTNLEEAKLCLFVTPYNKVVLRADDQAWLGRSVVVPLKHIPKGGNPYREYPEYMHNLEDCKERLFNVFKEAFGMTIDNQAQLGNLTKDELGKSTVELNYFHIHHHFIPRYAQGASWNNEVYPDPQFTQALNINPQCGHNKVLFSAEKLQQLKETIQLTMISMNVVKWEELAPTLPTERVRQAAMDAGLLLVNA